MTGRFDIDIAAIAVGQLKHLVDNIDFARIEAEMGATQLRRFKTSITQIHADQQSWILHMRCRHHAEAKWSGTGDDDDVLKLDLAALNRVNGTGERLDKGGMLDGNRLGHVIVERAGRKQHVLRHRPEGSLAKSVDIVDTAHPILAVETVAAFPAGNDLL